MWLTLIYLVPVRGVEPPTFALRMRKCVNTLTLTNLIYTIQNMTLGLALLLWANTDIGLIC